MKALINLAMVFAFLTILMSANAFAKLGENESSVDSDVKAMHAQHRVLTHELFRVHEIESNGQAVHEYVNQDGIVFAVTWNGIAQPDLSQLFGAYYQEYVDADASTPNPKGRAPKQVKGPNVTVHRSGHMRDVRGKAYIPSLLPTGVDLNEIQ